jgi:hypothetical protein
MAKVAAVVNVEARGASGAAVMFETGPSNAVVVGNYARSVSRPVANSAMVEIYKRLPNDTDFSVFRRAGLNGLNFAIVGAASRYHSARDTPANLNGASLQHVGDSVFAAAHALAAADLSNARTNSDASYFDLFGRLLLAWPSTLDLPLAIIALVAILALCWPLRAAFTWRESLLSIAALIAIPAALFVLGYALAFPLGVWPGAHPLDHPQPWPGRVALIAAAFVASALVVGVARAGAALMLVVWIALAAGGVAIAALAPGAAYALVWPSLIFATASWVEVFRKQDGALPAAIGFGAAAVFWLAHFLMAETALGFALSQWRILTLAPLALALAGLLTWRAGAWKVGAAGAGVVMFAAAITAALQPAYTPSQPRGLNIAYVADPWSPPRWAIAAYGPQDEAFLKAAGFTPKDRPYQGLDHLQAQGRFKPATDQHLPPPNFALHATARQGKVAIVDAEIAQARNGFSLGLVIPANSGVQAVTAEGQTVLKDIGAAPAYATFVGLAGRPVHLSFTFDAEAAPKIVLYERAALPDTPEARALQALRPANAAPAYNGDSALTSREIALTAP